MFHTVFAEFIIAGLAAGTLCGAVAALVCAALTRERPGLRAKACKLAFFYPFACFLICTIAFLAYARTGRNVSLGYGYSMDMVGSTGKAIIQTPQNDVLFINVTGIGVSGSMAAIQADLGPVYVLKNLQSGDSTTFRNQYDLQAAARDAGIPASGILSPDDFSMSRRSGLSMPSFSCSSSVCQSPAPSSS